MKIMESNKTGHLLRKSYCEKHSLLHYPESLLQEVQSKGYLINNMKKEIENIEKPSNKKRKITKQKEENDIKEENIKITEEIIIPKVIIIFSGIHKSEYNKYIELLKKQNNKDIVITTYISTEVTHIITKSKMTKIDNQEYRISERTLKYLYIYILFLFFIIILYIVLEY